MSRFKTPSTLARVALLAAAGLVAACGATPLATQDAALGGFDAAKARGKAAAPAAGAPTGHYAKAEGLSGQRLLGALHTIVKTNKDLGYNEARDRLYGTIDDLDNDDVIECIYTGRRLSGVKDRRTAYRNHKGFDAEHVWPQSMGGDRNEGRADLHHLFPCDIAANSTRNNYPFGEVSGSFKALPLFGGAGEPSRLGDRKGTTVFHPRVERRGDIARALMYFYVRYIVPRGPERAGLVADGISTRNWEIEHDTVLRWHAQDPVTPAEMARNNAVHKAQGNRNPFIDRPELAARVGRFEAPKAL